MMHVPHWSRGLVPTHLQTLLHLEAHSNAPGEGQESSSAVGRWSSGDREVREIPSIHAVTFPSGSAGKESARNGGDLGSIPGLGRSPGEGKGCPLQYSGLENSKDLYSPWGLRLGHHWATFTSLHTVI